MIMSYTDGLSALGDFQKDVLSLQRPSEFQYENFFRMYLTEDSQYFYNLLSFSVYVLDELDPSTYYEITIDRKLPWTAISYNEYRNIDLWWLIMVVNKIYNPLSFPDQGSKIKIIYPQYVKIILTKLKNEN
jgi:hypothetical protein